VCTVCHEPSDLGSVPSTAIDSMNGIHCCRISSVISFARDTVALLAGVDGACGGDDDC